MQLEDLNQESGLAVGGGPAVRNRPWAPWPDFTADEIEAVVRVLQSGKINYWTGDEGRRFEQEFAEFAGCRYGTAVANGTVALELALYAAGIGPGDEVVVPSRTFIASASCAVMRGAVPVVADIDHESQTLTADTIRAELTPRTKAIVAVHLAGWPCDMDPILELAEQHQLTVIEDCAQAHGATYKGRPVGSIGHLGAFSFCQDKIMSTGGEGGMLVTNDPALWERAWSFKDHGKNFRAVYAPDSGPGFRWLHESFGTNWRLTEMQSALGRVLLQKLPERVKRRRQLAAILTEGLAGLPGLRICVPPDWAGHAYYKYYAFVREEYLKENWDRDRIIAAMAAEGVPCFSGSCSEIFREQAFPESWRPVKVLPVARELGDTSLMFLVHPTLTEGDMWDICAAAEKVFGVATAREPLKHYLVGSQEVA
jgi:dTDP-4-amino-4,6-dideoxygalactose transaminase